MLPLTHFYSWTQDIEDQRRAMRQFAECGHFFQVLDTSVIEWAVTDPGTLIRFRKDLKEFGLKLVDAHAPWGTWSDPGMPLEEWHDCVVQHQRIALDICGICGIKTMAFHTGNTFNSIFGRQLVLEDYVRMLIRSLEELLPVAEKNQVIIALENQWTPLNHTNVLLRVMKYFNSPWLGLCWDSGHANLMEKGQADPARSCVPVIWNDLGQPVDWEDNILEKMSPWLVNCHLHDNNGFQDEHKLPGQGTIDWERVRKVLKNSPRLQVIQDESWVLGLPEKEYCTTFEKYFGDMCYWTPDGEQ